MSKTTRRTIYSRRNQPRHQLPEPEPIDFKAFVIALTVLGTISLGILASEYQWAWKLLVIILAVGLLARLLLL